MELARRFGTHLIIALLHCFTPLSTPEYQLLLSTEYSWRLSLVSIFQVQSTPEDHPAVQSLVLQWCNSFRWFCLIHGLGTVQTPIFHPYWATHIASIIWILYAEQRLYLDGSDRYSVSVQTLHVQFATRERIQWREFQTQQVTATVGSHYKYQTDIRKTLHHHAFPSLHTIER